MADLSDLLRYGRGEFGTGPGDPFVTELGQREQDLLNQIREYDPDATWRWQDNSGSSNESGWTTPSGYVLDFDQTKLPSIGDSGKPFVTSAGQIMDKYTPLDLGSEGTPWEHMFTNVDDDRMYDPHNTIDSPYGRITDNRNLKPKERGFNWGALAPMLIGGLAALPTGGLSLGMLGNSLMSIFNGAMNISNGANPLQALGNTAAGFIPGLAGIPPGILSQLTSMGIRTAINGGEFKPENLAYILARYGINNAIGNP